MDTPLLTPGERNDVREDMRLYRRTLHNELVRIDDIERQEYIDEVLADKSMTVFAAINCRIALGGEELSRREQRDRLDLREKVGKWS